MTASPSRCPQCIASLPEFVGAACPHCGCLLPTPGGGQGPEVPAISIPAIPPPPPSRRSGRNPLVLVLKVLGAVVGGFLVISFAIGFVTGVRGALGRDEAVASPARDLIKEPCAEYRELSLRLTTGEPDEETVKQVIAWMKTHTTTFDRAAELDPELTGAAGAVHWLSDLFADPARAARTSMEEIESHEEPLAKTCTTGAGRV
jgi:hypothetical protein